MEVQRKSVVNLEAKVEAVGQERRLLLTKIATAEKILQRIRNLEENYRLDERESEDDLEVLGIPVGGEVALTPSGQNGSYRPGKPLLDQRANSSLRFRWV